MKEKNMTPKEALLWKISEASFAAKDMHLYLDTHPDDEKALAYFRKAMDSRKKLMQEYARTYGPLTIAEAADSKEMWQWVKQPFPWEKEGGCR